MSRNSVVRPLRTYSSHPNVLFWFGFVKTLHFIPRASISIQYIHSNCLDAPKKCIGHSKWWFGGYCFDIRITNTSIPVHFGSFDILLKFGWIWVSLFLLGRHCVFSEKKNTIRFCDRLSNCQNEVFFFHSAVTFSSNLLLVRNELHLCSWGSFTAFVCISSLLLLLPHTIARNLWNQVYSTRKRTVCHTQTRNKRVQFVFGDFPVDNRIWAQHQIPFDEIIVGISLEKSINWWESNLNLKWKQRKQ